MTEANHTSDTFAPSAASFQIPGAVQSADWPTPSPSNMPSMVGSASHPLHQIDNQKTAQAHAEPAQSAIDSEAISEAASYLQDMCHGAARSAGWWSKVPEGQTPTDPLKFSNCLMLIVSELAEAMEGDRKNLMDDHLPSRPMREVELADAIIRIFDAAGAYQMDLAGAVAEKLAYNAQRADHKPAARAAAGGKTY